MYLLECTHKSQKPILSFEILAHCEVHRVANSPSQISFISVVLQFLVGKTLQNPALFMAFFYDVVA